VSSIDLPALFVLRELLERKVIECGWARSVELAIDASEGSGLQIRADSAKRDEILQWIKRVASEPASEGDIALAREVAIHRFDTVRTDLQALTWERDPLGTLQDLETISVSHVQDVARIYF